jgi:hypothetical protein
LSRTSIALALVLCAGCARTTTRTISRTVEMGDAAPPSQAGAAEFVAAVAPVEGDGRCETLPMEHGRRLVVLRFAGAGGVERNVALRVDSAGALLSYSDVRGDLRPDGPGARTAITLGFDSGSGTAVNEHAGPGATQGLLLARTAEMLDLPNLGTPRRMIETVKSRCGVR